MLSELIVVFILVVIVSFILAYIFTSRDPRGPALEREMKETKALISKIKRVQFSISQEEFRDLLAKRCINYCLVDRGVSVPSELWNEYMDAISASVHNIYPKAEDLTYRHFTEAHQHIEFRRYLRELYEVYKDGKEGLEQVLEAFAEKLHLIMCTLSNVELADEYDADQLCYEAPLYDLVRAPDMLIQNLLFPGAEQGLLEHKALSWWRDTVNRNLSLAFKFPMSEHWSNHMGKVKMPLDANMTPGEMVSTYFKGLPFEKVFHTFLRQAFPEELRFEHHHIVAGSGHGKTQTLQFLLANDIQKVVEQGASVIVIDSQGDLIRNIRSLETVNEDNLVLIDPTDVEFPVCLNLFDMGMDRLDGYSQLHREQLLNGVLELYDFVLGSLLGAEMTQKQSVVFRYVTRLMLNIPDATIHTMLDLFQKDGTEKYQPHIDTLDQTARNFFNTEFNGGEFTQTKKQVVRRLYGILENQAFNRMFSHPKSKLDLFSEMNSGKIILINTAKDLLKETGTEIFGRFFVAMIAQAAQERATIPNSERIPTYVYIDEAQEYFDANIATILSQARKYKIGMIMAHQFLDQLSPKLQSSFMANTSIKFAGGVSMKDARSLASEMRVPAEEIASQPKGHFSIMLRGKMQKAMSISIPFGVLEALPKSSAEQFNRIRNAMREKYAVPIEKMKAEPKPPPQEDDAPPPKKTPHPRKSKKKKPSKDSEPDLGDDL